MDLPRSSGEMGTYTGGHIVKSHSLSLDHRLWILWLCDC